jgi:hypothetical protein
MLAEIHESDVRLDVVGEHREGRARKQDLTTVAG